VLGTKFSVTWSVRLEGRPLGLKSGVGPRVDFKLSRHSFDVVPVCFGVQKNFPALLCPYWHDVVSGITTS